MAALWISVLALTVSVISTIISYAALRKGGSVVKVSLQISGEHIVLDVANPGRGPVQILRTGICEHPSSPVPPRAARKTRLAHGTLREVPSSLELPMTLTGETTTGTLLDIKQQEETFRAWINGFYFTFDQFFRLDYERIACSPTEITSEAVLIRVFVRLGNGKTIYSPWWKPLALAGGNAYRPSTKTLTKGYINRLRYRAGLQLT